MPFVITCRCKKRLPVRDQDLGGQITCPHCGKVLRVPQGPSRTAPQPTTSNDSKEPLQAVSSATGAPASLPSGTGAQGAPVGDILSQLTPAGLPARIGFIAKKSGFYVVSQPRLECWLTAQSLSVSGQDVPQPISVSRLQAAKELSFGIFDKGIKLVTSRVSLGVDDLTFSLLEVWAGKGVAAPAVAAPGSTRTNSGPNLVKTGLVIHGLGELAAIGSVVDDAVEVTLTTRGRAKRAGAAATVGGITGFIGGALLGLGFLFCTGVGLVARGPEYSAAEWVIGIVGLSILGAAGGIVYGFFKGLFASDMPTDPAELVAFLRRSTEKARKRAVQQLLGLDPALQAAAIPALVVASTDKNADVQLVCVEILAHMAPRVAEAIPALMATLANKDNRVRQVALRAVVQLKVGAAPALSLLMELLADKTCRLDALVAIGAIGPAAAPAIPNIISAIQQKKGVSQAAVSAGIRALVQIQWA